MIQRLLSVEYKTRIYWLLGIPGVAAAGLVIYLFVRIGLTAETSGAIASALAVLAATIAAIPAIQLQRLQTDPRKPCPMPYLGITGEEIYIIVKNFGPAVAYDIRLAWNKPPKDDNGNPITLLDDIKMLVPGQAVSVNVGLAANFRKQHGAFSLAGKVTFKDDNDRRTTGRFDCQPICYQGGYDFTHGLGHPSGDELPRRLRPASSQTCSAACSDRSPRCGSRQTVA
jgi:hypothetical protein